MNKSETQFRTIVTRFGQLPGIVILLIISTFPVLANIQQTYYNIIYQWTLGSDLSLVIIGWWWVFCSFWIGTLIKYLHYKPRPIPRDTSTTWKKINAWSMPSIHASNAMICAFVFIQSWMWYQIIENITTQFWIVILLWIVLFLSIALSRIALRKHYPIDTLVWSALGFIIVAVLSSHIVTIIGWLDNIIALFI